MTCLAQRQTILSLIDEAVQAGARQAKASTVVGEHPDLATLARYVFSR